MRSELGAAVVSAAARQLNLGAALLALAVLADSAVEHYRGSYHNRAMYVPLASASLALAGSLHGTIAPRAGPHPVRDGIYALAAAAGIAGLGFHAYNINKRPGGWSWLNLFYAAPIGAPFALTLSGFLGRAGAFQRGHSTCPFPGAFAARRRVSESAMDDGSPSVRCSSPRGTAATDSHWHGPKMFGLPLGRCVAAISVIGLAGTAAEAALLHFRGAYHNPAMVLPVSVPPIAATLLGAAAVAPSRRVHRLARGWLKLTAFLGFAGVGLHAYGLSRNMGGWRNWSQNVLNGPPLPAPPSFTGLALTGLAALSLIEEAERGA